MVELKEANQNLEEQILKVKVEETIKGMQENLRLQESPSAMETQEIPEVTETSVKPAQMDVSENSVPVKTLVNPMYIFENPILTEFTREPLPMEVSETPLAPVASQSLLAGDIADDKRISGVNESSPPISVPQILATNVVIQDFTAGEGAELGLNAAYVEIEYAEITSTAVSPVQKLQVGKNTESAISGTINDPLLLTNEAIPESTSQIIEEIDDIIGPESDEGLNTVSLLDQSKKAEIELENWLQSPTSTTGSRNINKLGKKVLKIKISKEEEQVAKKAKKREEKAAERLAKQEEMEKRK